MKLLDLFCGAGGAGEGYRRAGFNVYGVDIEHHDYPCGPFLIAEALAVLDQLLAGHGVTFTHPDGHTERLTLADFDAVHASPPCQAYSTITGAARTRHPQLIAPVRDALLQWGCPYVIENVEGARRHLDHPIRLCGSSFGLRARRHRYFEISAGAVWQLPCEHARQGRPVGVYGDHAQDDHEYLRPDGTHRGAKARSLREGREALGIDWMDWPDLTEAIPPAFTEWIGAQLLEHLAEAVA